MSVVIITIIFFLIWKASKGLNSKITQLELTMIYFLWWTQKQHCKWPFYDPFSPGELKIEKKNFWLKLIIHQKHFDKRIFESRITQISDLFQMPHLKPCLSVVFTDFSLNARKLIMQTSYQCNWNKNESFHCS